MEKMGVNMCKNLFGKKLKEVRIGYGLTQAQLADRLGVSASTVGMYEQGRREPDNQMLSKICTTLNISTDYLLGHDSYGNNYNREVDDIINEFINTIEKRPDLMFDGKPIIEEDRDKIVAAIRIAASVAISCKKNKEKNDEK